MDTPTGPAILVIDDEPIMGWVMKKVLGLIAPGYAVHTCVQGGLALAYMEYHPVCCVITDYLMPHMSGLTVARKVTAQWPVVPVVLLTGGRSKTIEKAARAAGCRVVLEKPVHTEMLRAVIVPLLEAHPSER